MKKDALMKLRVTPDEKDAFVEAARIAGISLSAWARERLRSAARRELEDVGHPIAFLSNVGTE